MPSLHDKTIIIDGLIVSNFGPEIFRAMRAGGITAANCTCSIWEDFSTSMRAIAQWKTWFREHANLILQVYGIADIHRAKTEGKTGVILGWQNAVGFDDHLPFIEVAYELGLRIVQMTYNTATSVGSGCYEINDGGLTGFGRDVVDEFNRLGILVDLSHVGSKTAADVIAYSKKPVPIRIAFQRRSRHTRATNPISNCGPSPTRAVLSGLRCFPRSCEEGRRLRSTISWKRSSMW